MPENQDVAFMQLVLPFLVNNVAAIRVERKIDDRGTLIELTVSKEDMRHVIGKQGGTVKAIRQLLAIVGTRSGQHVSLKVLEPVQ